MFSCLVKWTVDIFATVVQSQKLINSYDISWNHNIQCAVYVI